MLFEQEFIDWVEANPIQGVSKAIKLIHERLADYNGSSNWSEVEHEVLWEGASFIDVVLVTFNIEAGVSLPEATSDMSGNCANLINYIEAIKVALDGRATLLRIEALKSKYATALSASFAYEFTQGDLDRVQELIGEIRMHLVKTSDLEDGHKNRLLKRLEKLQSELNKRVSDLDGFYGLMGDAGMAVGKFGRDALPIVKMVREITKIVWKTQARAGELPSDADNPLLESSET